MKVFGAFYCENIHESTDELLSLHIKEEDAVISLNKHRNKENERDYVSYGFKNDFFKSWHVEEIEVK